MTPYDEPQIAGGRLHFRNGYQEGLEKGWTNWEATGEWSAYIVKQVTNGTFDVLFQRLPERSSARTESLRASFSRPEDATKFVIVNVLDSARSRHGLDSLFVMFRAIGLDQRVAKVAPDEASEAKVLALLPPDKEELVKNHLRKFVLKDDPLTSAVGFPGVEPYLNVLPMTYREVDSALTAGMPPPILECLGGRDSRL